MKGRRRLSRLVSVVGLASAIGCGGETGTGSADEADTVAVSSELAICWGDIPSCSACELDYASPMSNATGKFTCLPSKNTRADVVTNLGTTPMSTMPTLNVTFNFPVPTSSRPSTAYIQLKYQDPSGFWAERPNGAVADSLNGERPEA